VARIGVQKSRGTLQIDILPYTVTSPDLPYLRLPTYVLLTLLIYLPT